MPHGKQNKKSASGAGTIRKKTVTQNGKEYTYWEARYTIGFDPGTGKQRQKSVTGETQKEVAQKLRQITTEIDKGTYQEPCKMTGGEWMDVWAREYLGGVKPRTEALYKATIANYIKPALGAIRLEALNSHTVQHFYNELGTERNLSPKTVKNIHGVFHKALQQAVKVGYLRFTPADACELPRVERKEIKPLDSEAICAFVNAVQAHPFKAIYLTTLFTGIRRGEACGLQWDCVDLERGTIRIDKQLQNVPGQPGKFRLISTKNGKSRTITAAASIVKLLRQHLARQSTARLEAGPLWQDDGFVFTDEIGHHLSPNTVYHHFKRLAASIGFPEARLHDLRHSYAVAALQAGDDICKGTG